FPFPGLSCLVPGLAGLVPAGLGRRPSAHSNRLGRVTWPPLLAPKRPAHRRFFPGRLGYRRQPPLPRPERVPTRPAAPPARRPAEADPADRKQADLLHRRLVPIEKRLAASDRPASSARAAFANQIAFVRAAANPGRVVAPVEVHPAGAGL